MKFFKEIITDLNYPKSIEFQNDYFEHYEVCKQTSGRSFTVDFQLKITQGVNETINVYWIKDEQTANCIEYIFVGIKEFIQLKNSLQIAVKPFEIIISKAVIHPVDFDPQRYTTYTLNRLNEIAFEISQKRITYTETQTFQIIDEELALTKNTKFPSKPSSNVYNILLPTRKKQKLLLPAGYECHKNLVIKRSFSSDAIISIVIEGNSYESRHINRLSLMFDYNNINDAFGFSSIVDGVIKFVNDISNESYDLGGLNIYILNSNLNYFHREFSEQMYWSLLELIVQFNKAIYL